MNWVEEMRENARREAALLSGPGSQFYHCWKYCGSPNCHIHRAHELGPSPQQPNPKKGKA